MMTHHQSFIATFVTVIFIIILQTKNYSLVSGALTSDEIESLNWLQSLYQTSWTNIPSICNGQSAVGIQCTPGGNVLSILLDSNARGSTSTTGPTSTTISPTSSTISPTSSSGGSGGTTTDQTTTSATSGGISSSAPTTTDSTTTDATTVTSSSPTITSGPSTSGSTTSSQPTTTSGTSGTSGGTTSGTSTPPTTSPTSSSPMISSGGTTSGTSTPPTTSPTSSSPMTSAGGTTITAKTTLTPDITSITPVGVENFEDLDDIAFYLDVFNPAIPVTLPVLSQGALVFPYLTNLTILGSITPVVNDTNILQYIHLLNTAQYIRITDQPFVTGFSNFPTTSQTSLTFIDLTNCNMVSASIPSSIWSLPSLATLRLGGNQIGLGSTAVSNSLRYVEIEFSSGGPTVLNLGSIMPQLIDGIFGFYIHVSNIMFASIENLTLKGLLQSPRIELGFSISTLANLKSFSSYNCKLVSSITNSYSNLRSVNLNNVTYDSPTTWYISSIPSTLEQYSETQGIAVSLPSTIGSIQNVNLNTNPSFNPPSTAALCTAQSVDLRSTGLVAAAVDPCFICYSNQFDMTSWFDVPLTYNSNCGSYLTLVNNQFNIGRAGGIVTLQGNGLGWGRGSGVTSGLQCIIPNKVFTFVIPQYSGNQLQNIVLSFSSSMTALLIVTYTFPKLNTIEFQQGTAAVTVVLNGTFYETPTFTIENVPCPVSVSGAIDGTPTSFQCTLPQDFKEGLVTVVANGTTYGAESKLFYYLRTYPLVTSTSNVPSSGGILTLYGSFMPTAGSPITGVPDIDIPSSFPTQLGYAIMATQATPNVTVGGKNCDNVLYDATQLNCTLPADTRGPKEIIVTIDNYVFKSKSVFFMGMLDPPTCPSSCPTHSTCDTTKGECVCDTGFAGPTCLEIKKDQAAPETTLEVSQTKPDSSITTMGSLLGVQIVGIAEIDIDGATVTEVTLDKQWDNTTSSTSSSNTTYSFSTSIYGNSTVEAQVITFKEESTVEFAGKSETYAVGSLKVQFAVYNWPFVASTNTLRVIIYSSTNLTQEEEANRCKSAQQSTEVGLDDYQSVNYLILSIDAVTYYGRFMDRALSDGRPVYSPVSVLNKTEGNAYLAINLPHCQACILDPDYSLLITNAETDDGCSSDSSRKWVVAVAVVIPCVVVAAAVVAVVVLKRRFYITTSGKSIKIISRGKSQTSLTMKVLRG